MKKRVIKSRRGEGERGREAGTAGEGEGPREAERKAVVVWTPKGEDVLAWRPAVCVFAREVGQVKNLPRRYFASVLLPSFISLRLPFPPHLPSFLSFTFPLLRPLFLVPFRLFARWPDREREKRTCKAIERQREKER